MCSDPGQEMIKNDIRKKVWIGLWLQPVRPGCTSLLFGALERCRLNGYLLEMANIRDMYHGYQDKEEATKKPSLVKGR